MSFPYNATDGRQRLVRSYLILSCFPFVGFKQLHVSWSNSSSSHMLVLQTGNTLSLTNVRRILCYLVCVCLRVSARDGFGLATVHACVGCFCQTHIKTSGDCVAHNTFSPQPKKIGVVVSKLWQIWWISFELKCLKDMSCVLRGWDMKLGKGC